MELFIDTANLDEIREAASWGIIDGCTTNPSLIAREGRDFAETIYEICEIVQGPTSAEVVAQDSEGMLREARLLRQIHEHVVIKVPLTPEGLKTCKVLTGEGTPVNVTLCFSLNQALLAAKAGATYISPFLGRLDDIGHDGTELIADIVQCYENYFFDTKVLAASIRHPQHVTQVSRLGAHVSTMPFKVLRQLFNHTLTDKGNAAFMRDWEKVGEGVEETAKRFLEKRGS